MFFRDFDMVLRRVSDIVAMESVRESERQHHAIRYRLEMADKQYRYVDEISAETILDASAKLLPAVAGAYLLDLNEPEEGEEQNDDPFIRLPVLGWRVNTEGGVRPITSSGYWSDSRWNVLMPDGCVIDGAGSTYSSESEYVVFLKSNHLL
jgi:hypothetical protein